MFEKYTAEYIKILTWTYQKIIHKLKLKTKFHLFAIKFTYIFLSALYLKSKTSGRNQDYEHC